MGLEKTTVDAATLRDEASEDGVGALGLSQSDTECRTFQAKILEIEEVETGTLIRVDGSPLFPGGGGQPPDRGWVDGQKVLAVLGHEQLIIAERPAASTVTIEVDWSHRFDMMQQHTGQHLISAIASERYGWSTLSFHLSEESAFVVLDTPTLDESQRQTLEEQVNASIRSALPVSPRLATESDLSGGGIRCRKLPEVRAGGLRLVEIKGIDLNTCGGTHVSNTAQLQVVRLTKSDPHRGAIRLYFEVGNRVIGRAWRDAAVHHQLNLMLSCSVPQYEDSVRRLQAETKSAAKLIKRLRQDIAEMEATHHPLPPDQSVTVLNLKDKDMGQLGKMAQILLNRDAGRAFVLLSKQSQNDWLLLMVAHETWIDSEGRGILSRLNGKGGGAGGRLQGKVHSDDLVQEFLTSQGIDCDSD